ncbi:MAG: type II secretion system protein GspN [Acidobacteriota bacterium]
MRWAMICALVACGTRSASQPSKDAIEYAGDVDLATRPTSDSLGLPMTGIVHVEVHLAHATPDLRNASGTVRVTCAKGCQLGDDKAKLVPATSRANAFVGDGLDFGHLVFDSFDIAITFANGTATITTWNVTSPDVQLVASGRMKLGRTVADSSVDMCLRFGATPALRQRSPKTAAMIELTGAPRSTKDGLFNIQLLDRVDQLKRLARVCDGSQPPVAALPPPAAAPATKGDADTTALITSAIKPSSELAFDIDLKKWSQMLADPTTLAKGARVVPAVKNGKPAGFKIYGVKPDSFVAHLGLESGDTITSVAGEPMASIDKALEVYTKLRGAKVGDIVKVTVERRGAPTTLTYTLR